MGLKEWLVPEEKKFFDYFEKEVEAVKKGVQTLVKMTKDYGKVEHYASQLDNIEHESDCIVHEIMTELNKTFITPIDREDIHELATTLDDVIDIVDAVGRRLIIYDIRGECPNYLPEYADLLIKGVKQIEKAIKAMRDSKFHETVEKACIKINEIENEGDYLLSKSLKELFKCDDAKFIIKMKEIYDMLEFATDKCEEVANLLHGIMIKNT